MSDRPYQLSNGQGFLYWHGDNIFTKPFDTVDHEIRLHKLKALACHNLTVLWLESYLKNRNQKTEINGIFLIPRVVPCGVLQGSILGPLPFLIYVTDMEAAVF